MSSERIHHLSPADARALFDSAARRYMNMSGEEFLRRYDAGEWPDCDALPGLAHVVMLIPMGRAKEE